MIIHRIRKGVSWKMISLHNHELFSYSISVCERGGSCSVSQTLQTFVFTRIRCFRSSHPMLTVAESFVQTPISPNGLKISRVVRSDAQAALFDYLHCTRGFSFPDAEHISKNSPRFVHKLLSKVESEEDVPKALSRLFRYQPINEFEPFLESLGLSPDEIAVLLPRNLMFLSDNPVLLDNYHVLSRFGIPRSNIGKIYKEATEVFGYGDGVLNMKLMACENLGLSRSTLVKLLSCSPSVLVGDINNELYEVIEKMRKMGFGNDWVRSYLSIKNSYNWSRILRTMFFLSKIGYSEAHMGTLIKSNPALLFEESGSCTYVLVARLVKLGFKIDEIFSLLSKHPKILSLKHAKRLSNATNFLFEIGMETEVIAKIVSSHIGLLSSNSLKRPKTVLKYFKGDRQGLCQTIREDPLNLFRLASMSEVKNIEQTAFKNPATYSEKTRFLLKLGYVENSDEMTKALKMFRGRGDQLQERFDCLVEAGLDFNGVVSMVKQAPTLLNQSKDVLKKKVDSLEHLGYPVETILSFPSYLCYDTDRINCRFSMYVWLKEKGVAKPMLSLSTLLACSDVRFAKYFVDVHPEGPAMWESFKKLYHAN